MNRFRPDLDRLLQPISPDDPGGEWLRYTDVYDAVQEARRADDPSVPQGIWKRDLKKADWGRLASLCETAIRDRSKDLYLAVWLVEAWLHRHGVAGVAAGVELLHGLSDRLWEELFPRVDPLDPDVRSAPYEWLNDKLPPALGSVVVTRPDSKDVAPCSWGELVQARAAGLRDADGEEPGGLRFHPSVGLTPTAWLRERAAEIEAAVGATDRLGELLRERAPHSPPSLRRIEEALGDMKRWIDSVLASREPEGAPATPGDVTLQPEERVAMPIVDGGAIRSREEAYRLLAAAAEYLQRVEPHSPTPYLVRRAVSWGKMPLSELLEEYSHEGNDLRSLRMLLGLGSEP